MNINLPKYNQTVYAELLQAMVWNNKCALCAATGTGKSYIAAKFVQEAVIEQNTLILVPFRASAKIWNTLLPQATTMTYQGLLYNRPELAKYKLIICDEMHHLGADEWGKVFNELTENYHGKLLGLSATVHTAKTRISAVPIPSIPVFSEVSISTSVYPARHIPAANNMANTRFTRNTDRYHKSLYPGLSIFPPISWIFFTTGIQRCPANGINGNIGKRNVPTISLSVPERLTAASHDIAVRTEMIKFAFLYISSYP